jgi:hypothetical protein
MVFAISINGVLWSVVKRATRRRVNVKCGTVPFSLGGWQSSPVTEVEREREREGQAEIRIQRFFETV